MVDGPEITLAIKCAPDERLLGYASEAGITAAEIYTDAAWLRDVESVRRTCAGFPLRYALHAPGEGYEPEAVASLAGLIGAEVVVFHNVYFEDEWSRIVELMRPLGCKLAIENVLSAIDNVRYMRRFGLGRCLDIEHLVLETSGIFEEPLLGLMRQAVHVHMTGYVYGSRSWHTHIHHAPEQSMYLLDLLKRAGYGGMVVSEARGALQTALEFGALHRFFRSWLEGNR